MRARVVKSLLVAPYRIDRIEDLAPGLARAGFRERWDEPRMIGAGDRHHRVSVGVGSHSRAMLVRRPPRGNEMNFVQMEAAFGGARHGKVPDVNGIESAAEKRNAAFVLPLPGNAARFRWRDAQRSSFRRAPSRARARGEAGEATDGCAGDSFPCGSRNSAASSAFSRSGSGGAKRSSASAMARTSCGMPSPEADEIA